MICSGIWIVCHCVSWRKAVCHFAQESLLERVYSLCTCTTNRALVECEEMRVQTALEVRRCHGRRLCIVYPFRLLVAESRREALDRKRQPHCIELRSISNPVLIISKRFEALTDRVSCDVLHREFEHCGVKKDDSLNGKDPRTKSITPGPLTAAENVVECIAIICCDAVRCGSSSQTRKNALVIDADTQNAVVGNFGRDF